MIHFLFFYFKLSINRLKVVYSIKYISDILINVVKLSFEKFENYTNFTFHIHI